MCGSPLAKHPSLQHSSKCSAAQNGRHLAWDVRKPPRETFKRIASPKTGAPPFHHSFPPLLLPSSCLLSPTTTTTRRGFPPPSLHFFRHRSPRSALPLSRGVAGGRALRPSRDGYRLIRGSRARLCRSKPDMGRGQRWLLNFLRPLAAAVLLLSL